MIKKYDVAIIGAGLVGSITALLLAKYDFNVLLLDAGSGVSNKYFNECGKFNQDVPPDIRMSAITLRSREILDQFGIFSAAENRFGIMKKVKAWEESGASEINLDCLLIGKQYLSNIVENNLLLEIIHNKIKALSNITRINSCKISDIYNVANQNSNSSEIETDKGNFIVSLVVGADGANSFVRKYFEYNVDTENYNHTALVANVYTEKSHNNTAYQCFFKEGPLAFLPWQDSYCSSIVWSQSQQSAEYWTNCSEKEFLAELGEKFNYKLGKVIKTGQRACFPLIRRHAENYFKSGSVLIGDAAHTIHPLAGQGLNLGIYDAYELAEVLVWAKNKNYHINADYVLNKYQLKRKGHNQQVMTMMGLFKDIYSSDSKAIGMVRNLGVNLLDNISFLKKQMARYAAGFY